jgi:hypothetical protein
MGGRTAPIISNAEQQSRLEADLQALRERLAAEGVHGPLLAEVIVAARRVVSEPGHEEVLQIALRDPAALAERIRAVAPRPNTVLGGLGSFVIGLVAGPLLAYAALGNPWRTIPPALPRWGAGIAGLVALALLFAVTSRFARPGVLGIIAGVAGGLAEVVVAAGPWLAIASAQPGCVSGGACTVAPTVALGYGAVAALVYGVPLIVALAGLSSIIGLWVQRARLMAAIRRAR